MLILSVKQADVQGEIKLVEDSIGESSKTTSWISLIRDKSIRKPLLLCVAAMFFQQASGASCVMLYADTILKVLRAVTYFLCTSHFYLVIFQNLSHVSLFQDAGVTSDILLDISILGLSALQIMFTIVASFFMERAGKFHFSFIMNSCLLSNLFYTVL